MHATAGRVLLRKADLHIHNQLHPNGTTNNSPMSIIIRLALVRRTPACPGAKTISHHSLAVILLVGEPVGLPQVFRIRNPVQSTTTTLLACTT